MAAVKIESNIPYPGARSCYPSATDMKVGQSFLVPGRHAYMMAADRTRDGRIFKARKVGDGQFRVWRMK